MALNLVHVPTERSCQKIYSYQSKDMANLKVFPTNERTNGWMDKRTWTGQKLYATDLLLQRLKKLAEDNINMTGMIRSKWKTVKRGKAGFHFLLFLNFFFFSKLSLPIKQFKTDLLCVAGKTCLQEEL